MAKIKRTPPPIDLIDINETSNHQIKKLVTLNNRFAAETSRLEVGALEEMAKIAFCAYAISPDIGLLLAFDENADYQNENFNNLKELTNNFIYIDRVIINKEYWGMGLGSAFYDILSELAQEANKDKLVCEVNIEPLNEDSIAFHEALGFSPIGEKELSNGKTVRYYQLEL